MIHLMTYLENNDSISMTSVNVLSNTCVRMGMAIVDTNLKWVLEFDDR